jgi:hypothetical protein
MRGSVIAFESRLVASRRGVFALLSSTSAAIASLMSIYRKSQGYQNIISLSRPYSSESIPLRLQSGKYSPPISAPPWTIGLPPFSG